MSDTGDDDWQRQRHSFYIQHASSKDEIKNALKKHVQDLLKEIIQNSNVEMLFANFQKEKIQDLLFSNTFNDEMARQVAERLDEIPMRLYFLEIDPEEDFGLQPSVAYNFEVHYVAHDMETRPQTPVDDVQNSAPQFSDPGPSNLTSSLGSYVQQAPSLSHQHLPSPVSTVPETDSDMTADEDDDGNPPPPPISRRSFPSTSNMNTPMPSPTSTSGPSTRKGSPHLSSGPSTRMDSPILSMMQPNEGSSSGVGDASVVPAANVSTADYEFPPTRQESPARSDAGSDAGSDARSDAGSDTRSDASMHDSEYKSEHESMDEYDRYSYQEDELGPEAQPRSDDYHSEDSSKSRNEDLIHKLLVHLQ